MLKVDLHTHTADDPVDRIPYSTGELIDRASARGYDALEADPARALARIEKQLRPGAIVLLHEGARHGRNVELVALLLDRLRTLGYRAVLPAVGNDPPVVERGVAVQRGELGT